MVKILDDRYKKGRYGVRIHLMRRPKEGIQEFFSFRENRKTVPLARRQEILEEAKAREAFLIQKYDIKTEGDLFITHSQSLLNGRTHSQPIRLSGANLRVYRPSRDKHVPIKWVKSGPHDIHFYNFTPRIEVRRKRRIMLSTSLAFHNRREYTAQYKALVDYYGEHFNATLEQQEKMIKLKPKWPEVKTFLLAEALRLYHCDPFDS